MGQAVMPRADPTPPAGRKYAYAAFISYSHHDEAELRIARAIEHGLEQLGKRWGRWRALDVFLDQHDLGANPGLEKKLRDAIGGSEFFIFLASPASASADSWCSKELLHWFEARGSEAAGHLLIVVTDGQLVFNDSADDVIDWDHSTAAPAVLRARLGVEPFYVDVSADRDRADRLDVRRDPSFRESVTKLAAPLHHCSPQELDSEDLRQYRRGRRLRRLAVGALAALAVAAAIAALLAVANTIEADRQSRRSESRALANVALTNATAERDLALLQALESIRVADTTDAWGSLLGVLGEPSRFQQRSTGAHDAVVTSVAWSDDGHLAATGDDAGAVVVWDVVADSLVHPSTARAYSPLQGSTAAIQQVDFFERDGTTVVEGLAVDGSYVVWDVATGEAITVGDAPAVALTAAARADDGGAVAGAVDTDGDGGADLVRTYEDGHVVAEAEVAGETVDHLHFQPGGKALRVERRRSGPRLGPRRSAGAGDRGRDPRQQRRLQRRRGPAGGGRVRRSHLAGGPGRCGSTVVGGRAAADEPTDRRGVRPRRLHGGGLHAGLCPPERSGAGVGHPGQGRLGRGHAARPQRGGNGAGLRCRRADRLRAATTVRCCGGVLRRSSASGRRFPVAVTGTRPTSRRWRSSTRRPSSRSMRPVRSS